MVIDPEEGPIFTQRSVVLLQTIYASQLTQTITFGTTKLAVLLLYQRIFTGEFFRKAVWVGYALVFCWTVGYFFAMLLQCWPISTNWTGPGGNPNLCVNTVDLLVSHAWSDTLLDFAILAMPLPCIWGLQMKIRHKIGVSAIFLLGLLTVGAGIARIVVFENVDKATQSGAMDVTWILTPTLYWPMIESSLGIVGACLPLLRPLFTGATSKGFVRKLRNVNFPTLTYHDPNGSKGSGTTAVASESSREQGSSSPQDEKKKLSGFSHVQHYSR